uniref:ADF-H domain-containing protein n=1 Tax=Steinernema glaseri TaxID=37863 RepID=A0A1I8AI07_9BILA
MVFREPKISSFHLDRAKARTVYFARKFDSMIDVNPIAAAERQSMRNRLHLIQKDHPAFNSTWVNFYSVAGDGDSRRASIYQQLSSLFLSAPLENIYAYKSAPDAEIQLVMSSSNEEVLVVAKKEKPEIKEFLVEGKYQLIDVAIGLDLQQVEEVFREYSGLPDTKSTVALLLHWTR